MTTDDHTNHHTGTIAKVRQRIAHEILIAHEAGEPVDIQTAAERALTKSLAQADELGWSETTKDGMAVGYANIAADMLDEATERAARKHPLLGRASKEPAMTTQPIPAPATYAEYLQIRDQLIDTHGNPLRREPCTRCNWTHYTVEPCATEVPCPSCGSTRARCLRPSEHEADGWHTERRAAFEALCAEREAHGLPQVARWPQPTTTPAADVRPAATRQEALF